MTSRIKEFDARNATVAKNDQGMEESSPQETYVVKTEQFGSLILSLYNGKIKVEKGLSLFRVVQKNSINFPLSKSQLQYKINPKSTNDPKKLELRPSPEDVEGGLYVSLMQARQQKFPENQILYLEKLSDYYLSKKEYVKAAHLLNGALSLRLTQDDSLSKKQLIGKLTLIEEKFLNFKGFKGNSQLTTRIERHRDFLKNVRDQCLTQFNTIDESSGFRSENFRKIPAKLTEGFKTLLKTLIEEAQSIFGKPPVEWACIGMGSMARNEMCPRSDVEFGFVLRENKPEALQYFRNLSEFLELQIINLGETKFSIFERVDKDQPSATPSGFSMDTGGNTPLGVKGVYELIGTPQQLAKFVGFQWIERGEILPNAMSAVCYVAGEQKLVDSYNVEKNKMLNTVEQKVTNREVLAFKLLSGHLEEFAPNLTLEKERTKAFGIKKELYRPFQEILGCLSLFYTLKENNTFSRINELCLLGILSQKGSKDLQDILADVLYLRVKAHYHYQDEKEYLCHPSEGEKRDNSLLYIGLNDWKKLESIYSVLFNFHNCSKEFFKSKSKNAFNKEMLGETPSALARKQQNFPTNTSTISGVTTYLLPGPYPNDKKSMDMLYEQMQQMDLQKVSEFDDYQKAVSLNPSDWISLMRLAKKEQELEKTEDALKHYLEAYKYVSPNVPHAAFIVKQIGDIYNALGKKASAWAYYKRALEIQKKLVAENRGKDPVVRSVTESDIFHLTHDLVYLYFELAKVELFLKQNKQAVDSFNEALALIPSIQGSFEFRIPPEKMKRLKIICNLLLGRAYRELRDYPNAIKIIEGVIQEYKVKKDNESIATATNDLARVYQKQGQTENALKYYSMALKLDNSNENKAFVNFAIANMYSSTGKYNDALKYAEQYLAIKQKITGKESIEVASAYEYLGTIYYGLFKYQKAFDFYKKSLEIHQKCFDKKNVSGLIDAIIWQIYSLWNLGQLSEALTYFHKSLNPDEMIMEQLDQDAIAYLFDLAGFLHFELGKYQEASEYYVKSLKIRQR